MNAPELIATAKALVAGDKGLLALDESTPTCDERFAKLGIPQTLEMRRAYRELIVTTPGLGAAISGAILYDETIRQRKLDGTPLVEILINAGIIPGIKVDLGEEDLAAYPGEKITGGLDGLRGRLAEVARDHHRGPRPAQPGLHRGQCPRAGPLRSGVPGSGAGSRGRTGSAHGWRAHP